MSAKPIDLSVVIPCYNEEIVLEESIEELIKLLNNTIFSYELTILQAMQKKQENVLFQSVRFIPIA